MLSQCLSHGIEMTRNAGYGENVIKIVIEFLNGVQP